MPTLKEMFPNFSSIQPSKILWDSDFEWTQEAGVQLAHALLQDAISSQELEGREFLERGVVLRSDLSALTTSDIRGRDHFIIDTALLQNSDRRGFTSRIHAVRRVA
jgi:hypothetical protein